MFKSVIVAIPVFNEEKNISKLLIKLRKKFKFIVVIDNCSTDKTFNIIKKFNIIKIKHIFNLGKSMSMKTALDYAILEQFKYIAYLDGDGQHKVEDLEKLIKKIIKDNADAIIGYRSNLQNLNLKKKIGTRILEFFFYFLFKEKIYDIQSGLRVIKTNVLKKINIESNGSRHYFADAEITCKLVKMRKKIIQIPIKTIPSQPYKGMNIVQGIYLVLNLFLWRLSK